MEMGIFFSLMLTHVKKFMFKKFILNKIKNKKQKT